MNPEPPVIPDCDVWVRAFGRLDPDPRTVHAFRELVRARRVLTLGWIRQDLLARLVELQYQRNDADLHRGTFRARGDVVEVVPAHESDRAIRIGIGCAGAEREQSKQGGD